MGGGLMQLVAYGAQDVYLTGNPQITFFKVVYRRHTNFSMECIQQTISGTPTSGGNSTVTISRNGDLVGKLYVSQNAGTVANNGTTIVTSADLEIGGQLIDRQTNEWRDVWNELSTPESKAVGLKAMQCDVGTRGTTGVNMLQVPLQFWFCRNPGLALPLIALQYHEVKVKCTWGGVVDGSAQIWADYVYLDTDERRRFAQVSHEYLIEQVQSQSFTLTASVANSLKLNFNHPVKELIWTTPVGSTYTNALLKLNGHDRMAAQEEEYYQLRQPYDHHTAVPQQNLPVGARASLLNGVYPLSANGIAGLNPHGTTAVGNDATHFAMPNTTTLELTDANVTALGLTVGTATNGETLAIITNAHGNTDQYTGDDPTDGTLYTATVHSVGAANTTHNGIAPGAGAQVVQLHVGFQDASTNAAGFPTAIAAGSADGVFALFSLNPSTVTQARTSAATRLINVYSFALKPEEHQPSGTCNFSRIDTARLELGTQDATGGSCVVYAVNYNVLRIMSGMGGLAYSN